MWQSSAGQDEQGSGLCSCQCGSCFDKDYRFHRQVIYNNPQLLHTSYLSWRNVLTNTGAMLVAWFLTFCPSRRGKKTLKHPNTALSLAHIAGWLLRSRESLGRTITCMMTQAPKNLSLSLHKSSLHVKINCLIGFDEQQMDSGNFVRFCFILILFN